MKLPVAMRSLATAVPSFQLDQTEVAAFARRLYGQAFDRFPKLADVFVNAGIDRRYSVRPMAWFDEPHDWPERTQAYLDGCLLYTSPSPRDRQKSRMPSSA